MANSSDPNPNVVQPVPDERLDKQLGLFDVYAISTGAMFSSGFFLLPGVAAAQAGPSVVLAYLIASILTLPAMFSMAELSTAMPKAGGAYYFLDRSLGPLAGTIGGLGNWVALILKSAFALIGMGAYLAIFFELPIEPLAVALTIAFGALNIFGAKETTGLQKVLVAALVAIMTFFIVQGLFAVFNVGVTTVHAEQFTPFLPFGLAGLFSTIGMVFISYAGLTKVASVAEEIRNPDRNIPLGMILSLITATLIYVVGVYIMVAVLPPADLRADLTPVATAGEAFLDWLPPPAGLILIVIAAIAAFASTGNAGILSASRYPFAMARDHLLWPRFSSVGRFKTPTTAIVTTCGLMIGVIVLLDVESVAKLGSAVQLFIFALINFAVIVMRESRISSYVPGYLSPFYPWMQIFGIATAVLLIIEIGTNALLLTVALVGFSIFWYFYYARTKARREGAIYHVFARMGRRRFEGLDYELRDLVKERTLEESDPYESSVAKAPVLDLAGDLTYEEIIERASATLSERLPIEKDRLAEMFLQSNHIGSTPVSHGAALPDLRLPGIKRPELLLVRLRDGVKLRLPEEAGGTLVSERPIHAFLFLVSPQSQAGQHLRMLAELVSRVDEAEFLREWCAAEGEQALREVLLRHERFISLTLEKNTATAALIDQAVREISGQLPASTLIALIQREDKTLVPRGSTVLREGDRITIIGNPNDISELYGRYRARTQRT